MGKSERLEDAPFVKDTGTVNDSVPRTGDRVMVIRGRCTCIGHRALSDEELADARAQAAELDDRVIVLASTTDPEGWVLLAVVDKEGICPPF